MIDHLLRFHDEQDAKDQLPELWSEEGGWRGDICIPGVSVYTVTGTESVTDQDSGETYMREIRVYKPEWYIIIAHEKPMITTYEPKGKLRLVTDRDAAIAGQPFILYSAPDLSEADLNNTRVEPTFAGSDYPNT